MIVILWKATRGSWEADFAAGGFYIMLVSLGVTTDQKEQLNQF
jgi:hypothetical protein